MQNEMMTPCSVDEDEIDLKELFATIWKHKLFILLFTFVVTVFSIIYALAKPNEYKIYTILAPQEQSKSASLGGLGALASMAGVNLGSNSGITPDIAFQSLLDDYPFMKKFIQKNRLDQKLSDPALTKDYIFALGYNGIYNLFHVKAEKKDDKIDFFTTYYKPLKSSLAITADKKTSLITISYTSPSRKLAKEVLTSFLKDATQELVRKNINDINSQIKRYKQELQKTNNLELKSELAKLISSLIKQKVYINTSKYYKVKVITDPFIPDPKDKAKPKRALIVVVSFITGLILSIFLLFFYIFIKGDDEADAKK